MATTVLRTTVYQPSRHTQRRRHVSCRSTDSGKNGTGSRGKGLDEPIELIGGKVTSGPSLAISANGINFPNPFVIGSGPPGVWPALHDREKLCTFEVQFIP